MGAVLASKNSFCEPENGELPVLDNPSNILGEDDLVALRNRLPPRLMQGYEWRRMFCTEQDGFSLANFYRRAAVTDSPVLLVIQVFYQRGDPGKVCSPSGCPGCNIRRPPLRGWTQWSPL